MIAGDIVDVSGSVLIRTDPAERTAIAKVRTAHTGDPLFAQDVVNTGSNGRIKILLRDKSIIDLGPSALFKMDKFDGKNGRSDREVQVSMIYGSMRAAITQKLKGKGQFKVRTPSATMGVRGTEFIVKSSIKDPSDVTRMLNHASASLIPSKLAPGIQKKIDASTQVTVLQGVVAVAKREFDARAEDFGRNPASVGIETLTAGSQITAKNTDMALPSIKPVNPVQLQTIAKDNKIVDHTFQQAVVIDPTQNAGNRSPEALKQIVASAIVNVPTPPIRPSDISIPGTLGNNQALTPPPINLQGVRKHLRVIIVTGQ